MCGQDDYTQQEEQYCKVILQCIADHLGEGGQWSCQTGEDGPWQDGCLLRRPILWSQGNRGETGGGGHGTCSHAPILWEKTRMKLIDSLGVYLIWCSKWSINLRLVLSSVFLDPMVGRTVDDPPSILLCLLLSSKCLVILHQSSQWCSSASSLVVCFLLVCHLVFLELCFSRLLLFIRSVSFRWKKVFSF